MKTVSFVILLASLTGAFHSSAFADDDPAKNAGDGAAVSAKQTYETAGGKYEFTMDASETPDLAEWAQKELAPVVKEWYPKIVQLLPSDGFEAPARFSIALKKDMRGVAATGGTHISCGAEWFCHNLKGEAKGAVVHELVHVVQQYGHARR